jgi:bacteriocin biosynthesis cyclodehydratase domain-containing protein
MEKSFNVPAYPRLCPGTELIGVDGGAVLLRSFSRTVMLSGEFVKELPDLIAQMDGRTPLAELASRVPEGGRAEFEQFLALLANKGMLCDGSASGLLPANGAHRHQDAFWSVQNASLNGALERMKRTHVVIVDLGGVGLTVTLALADAGFTCITGLDHQVVRGSDLELGYRQQELGKLRADAVAERLNTAQCQRFRPVTQPVQSLSNWDDLVSKADLVVLCSDGMSLAAYERTNETCLRHKKRWVSARIDRQRGIIGPFVAPEETACFTCFELRSRANSEHPSDHTAIYRHWKNTIATPDDWPVHPAFAAIVGNYLALDIQRVVVGNQVSAFLGRMLHLDFQTLESRFHDILKLPRCPACSRERSRPLTRIWDIRAADASASVDRHI